MREYSLEDFNNLLDQEQTPAAEVVPLLSAFWNKNLQDNKKIEAFLLNNPEFLEDFISFNEIPVNKTSEQITIFESIELCEETEKAMKVLNVSVPVPVKLKAKTVSTYEEVVPETTWKKTLKNVAQTTISLSVSAMLLGPLVQTNMESFAAIPRPSQNWTVGLEGKYNDPLLTDNIKDVLAELQSQGDRESEDVAKKLLTLNLEDVGIETDQEIQGLKTEEREATINKIESLINSYYTYKISNARVIAENVFDQAKEKDLDYHILLGIIKTESDFSNQKVSTTGDFSLAQINYRIWSQEMLRVKNKAIDPALLKGQVDIASLKKTDKPLADLFVKKAKGKPVTEAELEQIANYENALREKSPAYSIELMADILSILKNRHKQDKLWFARYHSGTLDLKTGYAKKVMRNIKHMDKVNQEYLVEQVRLVQNDLNKMVQSHDLSAEKVRSLNGRLDKILLDKTDTLEAAIIAKN